MAGQAGALEALTLAFEQRLERERSARLRAEAALLAAASVRTATRGYPAFAIGAVRSPFSADHGSRQQQDGLPSAPVLRGAPRQGALAPDVRASLVLSNFVHPDALDGLAEFSHVYVFFLFSEDQKTVRSAASAALAECPWVAAGRSFFAKVAPPGLGGERTGVFATRSPHRPNAVGVSLCVLRGVDAAARTLHLSGVDLFDGTPVLDVKPACEYDCGTCSTRLAVTSAATVPALLEAQAFPGWVASPLQLAPPIQVVWRPEALARVRTCMLRGASRFYHGGSDEEAAACVRAIEQVVALDPRSLAHGRGAAAQRHTTALESARIAAAAAATGSDPESAPAAAAGPIAGCGPYELRYDVLLLTLTFASSGGGEGEGPQGQTCVIEGCEEMRGK